MPVGTTEGVAGGGQVLGAWFLQRASHPVLKKAQGQTALQQSLQPFPSLQHVTLNRATVGLNCFHITTLPLLSLGDLQNGFLCHENA